MTNKFFNPSKKTDWHKNLSESTRRRNAFSATDKRKSKHDRNLEAARRLQALANVTTDRQTAAKAKRDADYFFNRTKNGVKNMRKITRGRRKTKSNAGNFMRRVSRDKSVTKFNKRIKTAESRLKKLKRDKQTARKKVMRKLKRR